MKTVLSIASIIVGNDKYTTAPGSRPGLTPHWLVGQSFESKVPVRVTKKQNLLCEQPRSIDRPNTSSDFFVRSLFNSRSSDAGTTQVATKNCDPTDISDGGSK